MTLAQHHTATSPQPAFGALDLGDAWADARADAWAAYHDWSAAERAAKADLYARYAAAAEREDAAAALYKHVVLRAATAVA